MYMIMLEDEMLIVVVIENMGVQYSMHIVRMHCTSSALSIKRKN